MSMPWRVAILREPPAGPVRVSPSGKHLAPWRTPDPGGAGPVFAMRLPIMTFDEAMKWCRIHQAIWGFAEGPLGRGRRLWLRVQAHIVESVLPSWCTDDCSAVLTRMVEQMRAALAPTLSA